jgi:FixJ family two-component response regulator
VFVTAYPNIASTVRAIKAGAEDVLIKPIGSEELLIAVGKAFARQTSLLASKVDGEPLRARLGRLTPRERQVLEWWRASKSTNSSRGNLELQTAP